MAVIELSKWLLNYLNDCEGFGVFSQPPLGETRPGTEWSSAGRWTDAEIEWFDGRISFHVLSGSSSGADWDRAEGCWNSVFLTAAQRCVFVNCHLASTASSPGDEI